MLRTTLTTWKNLGLFKIQQDGRPRDEDVVELAPDLPADASDPALGPVLLPDTLRQLVLRPQNNANFWVRDEGAGSDDESEESQDSDDGIDAGDEDLPTGIRSADFTRGTCWCLALRPRLPVEPSLKAMWERVDPLQQETLDKQKHKVFGNDTRWMGLGAWVPFLGFGWSTVRQALVIDPTVAIRRELPSVFGDDDRLAQRSFLERLCNRLPVLDGGSYRREVEERLLPGRWEPPAAGALSESLSVALERLAMGGFIELEDRADADRGVLSGPGGRPFRSFSHVALRRTQL